METTIGTCGNFGIVENKMETTGIIGIIYFYIGRDDGKWKLLSLVGASCKFWSQRDSAAFLGSVTCNSCVR